MEILPSGGEQHQRRITPYWGYGLSHEAGPLQDYALGDVPNEPVGTPLDINRIIRRNWILLFALVVLGAAAGFASVVFSSPMYKASLLLEVQEINPELLKGWLASYEATDVNIQTQINILRGGPFLQRGAERLQSETVPLAAPGRGLFGRLRQKFRQATNDPVENAKRALAVSMATFDAKPVNRTRLIELTCESTSPEVAAQFLNAMAAEFVDDTSQNRMQSSRKTSEWLASQIEESKSKLADAEQRLQTFIQASGNLFVGQENTLDDTKLAELKAQLARIQADRIAKQARYERMLKSPPESLGEVLDNPVLRAYEQQINQLKRDRAALEITYTPKHEKVKKTDAQLDVLQKTYQTELSSVKGRIKTDYESALRQETMLSAAYASQSQRVAAEATKAAQYNSLKREVETQRQMYQSLLMQQNQASLSSSVPINPIRIVEPSSPPPAPYTPRPLVNISFGGVLGFAFTVAIAFVREKMDHSIRTPGAIQSVLRAPELGVIPKLETRPGNPISRWIGSRSSDPRLGLLVGSEETSELAKWQNAPTFLAESFRGALASLLRTRPAGKRNNVILVTSPGAGEGKTTVVQNLGIALAETGRRVLLIDGDFRRPHLHRRFGLPNHWTFTDILCDNTPLSDYTADRLAVKTAIPGLWVLPNRSTGESVAKVLYSPRTRAVIEACREQFDMILVDAPPLLYVADARVLAPATDALVLVIRSGVTSRESALRAYQQIQRDGLILLGTVLTACDSAIYSNYYEYADDVKN